MQKSDSTQSVPEKEGRVFRETSLAPADSDLSALVASGTDERGAAKYFHGREEVLSLFAARRARASAGGPSGQGTTFLIQGAPGAGKSALLCRCAEEAEKDGWTVAEINSRALYDPATMSRCLGKPYVAQSRRTLGAAWFASLLRSKTVVGIPSVYHVLKDIVPKTKGLLLVLDEVQRIGSLASHQRKADVEDTLEQIHNGGVGGPVILLAGGLGTSRRAFARLSISRFHRGCVVNLGRLPPGPERAIIRDWLVQDGGAQGDVTPWIDAIARETHGWPQHIITFAEPAAQVVRLCHGRMVPEGLRIVLRQGQEGKEEYYFARVEEIARQDRMALGEALATLPPGASMEEPDVLRILARNHARAEAKRIFELIVHKGVLAHTREGDFAVPIPSMHHWLVGQYGRARTQQRGMGL